MTAESEALRRLRWRCRRGLLELDLVFQRFLDRQYTSLNADDKAAFHRLLELQDNTLLAYLHGNEIPTDSDLIQIIKKM